MNAGMNWTAWNSVFAKALTSSPSDIPSRAFKDCQPDDDQDAVGAFRPRRPNPTRQMTSAWAAASSPKASA